MSEASPYTIGPRVDLQVRTRPYVPKNDEPLYRPLRIYSIDPADASTVGGIATVNVPYEPLEPGPVGELFEVDMVNGITGEAYSKADLDERRVLLEDGRDPTPTDPRFHAQMVYAVASQTYRRFRSALGRDIAWRFLRLDDEKDKGPVRLKLRPFAYGNRNAEYDRVSGEIKFGFFRADKMVAGKNLGGGFVFTALSHDIIVHEVSHALLDGLRSRFLVPTCVEVLAFHEAFADLVALLQHFSYSDVVSNAMAKSRGRLEGAAVLCEIARQFGNTTQSSYAARALRTAIDVEGLVSDRGTSATRPAQYSSDLEIHTMGSVLVSAVFEAYLTIFRKKSERLFRIAAIDPDDEHRPSLNVSLVRALADLASKTAQQLLNICIRAIDYCPVIDMQLGEYLRAVITADRDLMRADPWGYRDALMDGFRRRGIFPAGVDFLSEDAVIWRAPDHDLPPIPGLAFNDLRFDGDPGRPSSVDELRRQARMLGEFISDPARHGAFGLTKPGPNASGNLVKPPCVQSIRCARRVAPDDSLQFDLVAEVTQECDVNRLGNEAFSFYGGSTIVIAPDGNVRLVISKRVDNVQRMEQQHSEMTGALSGFWESKEGRREPVTSVVGRMHRSA
jgi:hypothetical protein